MIYANRRLQKSLLYKQIGDIKQRYYNLSLHKERKQQNFLNRLNVVNKSGEFLDLQYSFESQYKSYSKSIEGKVYAIEYLAKEKGLVPIFITLTLPSAYHPFRSISYKGERLLVQENPDFKFNSIEESISTGYQELQHIYRVFYKRVKNDVKDMMYIKVFEAHKTLIPHLHCLLFVKRSDTKIIREKFDNIVVEFELEQIDLSLDSSEDERFKTNVKRASKYMMKYITKDLSKGSDMFESRVLDGWKKSNKIRMITMSQLSLSLSEYRTIYHNIDKEIKEELLSKAKKQDISLYTYILKNMFNLKAIYENDVKVKSTVRGRVDRDIKMFVSYNRRRNKSGGYSYSTKSLILIINDRVAYEKEQYTIIGE
jgi:hypothetical protein